MKSLSTFIVAALGLILVAGCSVVHEANAGRYNLNTKIGNDWLSDQFDPAGTNVAGHWTSTDWGDVQLTQTGRNVGGKLGDYDVRGVVSGQRAYLLLSEAGWNYYAAVLERQGPGVLAGHFSRAIPFAKSFGRPMRLEQLAH